MRHGGRTVGRGSFSSGSVRPIRAAHGCRSWSTRACSPTTCLLGAKLLRSRVQDRAQAGSLHRAPERGEALARAGRHGAARRLLHRALHVLAERGETRHAAACALQLGWLAIERAQLAESVRYFGRARELSTHARTIVLAGIGIGVAWTDEGRLVEAEGALRTAALAAKTLDDRNSRRGRYAGLGRCLFWQGRHDEAAAVPAGRFGVAGGAARSWREPAWRSPASSWRKSRRHGRANGQGSARTRDGSGRCSGACRGAPSSGSGGRGRGRCGSRGQPHRGWAACCVARASAPGRRPAPARGARDRRPGHAASADHRRRRRPARRLLASTGPPLLRYAAGQRGRAWRGKSSTPPPAPSSTASGAAALGQHGCAPARTPSPISKPGLHLADRRRRPHRDRPCRGAAADASAGRDTDGHRSRTRAARDGVPAAAHGMAIRRVAWRAIARGVGVSVDPLRSRARRQSRCATAARSSAALPHAGLPGRRSIPRAPRTLLRMGGARDRAERACRARSDVPTPAGQHPGEEILGDSAPARSMRESIARAARAPFPVLIEGESGSGKELVARAIHRLGPRRDRRFCAINCAALSDDLLEAELFGHARGAFTGAVSERAGPLRGSGRRHAVPRRDRRAVAARAGQAAARAPGRGGPPRRREHVAPRRRPHRRGDQPPAGAGGRRRAVPRRPALPPRRRSASTCRRCATAPATCRCSRRSFWTEAAGAHGLARHAVAGRARGAGALRLARQRARAAERDRVDGRPLAEPRPHPCRRPFPAHVAQAAVVAGQHVRGRAIGIRAALRQGRARAAPAAIAPAPPEALGVTRQGLAKMLRRLALATKGQSSNEWP